MKTFHGTENISAEYRNNFNRNISHLKNKYPAVYDILKSSGRNLKLEITGDGSLTAKVNGIYLESKYNPGRHAMSYIEELKGPVKTNFFFGSGLGYHINAFLKKYKTKCLVIEKYTEVFKASLYIIEPQFFVSVVPMIGLSMDDLAGRIGSMSLRQPAIVRHPPSIQLSPEYYLDLEKFILNRLKEKIASDATEKAAGGLWLRNILKNLSHAGSGYRVTKPLCGLFSGSALLVASGPFIEDIIDELKPFCKKLPVFSLLPSVPYLMKNSIRPDFIITTDAGFGNRYRFVRHADTPLLSTFSNDASILKNWPCRVYLFSHGLPVERKLISLKNSSVTVPMQGTASIVMVILARIMGFSEIFLAGFDFAHRGLKDHHCSAGFDSYYLSTAYRMNSWQTSVLRGFRTERIVQGRSVHGRTVDSSHKLTLYKQWFENQIAGPDLIRLNDGLQLAGVKFSRPDRLSLGGTDRKKEFRERLNGVAQNEIQPENILNDLKDLMYQVEYYSDLSSEDDCRELYKIFYGRIPDPFRSEEDRKELEAALRALTNSIRYLEMR